MAGFEQTIIIGNVGRDPELKFLPSGDAVCNFSVAVGSSWTDKSTGDKREKTNWYSVSAFGKRAEVLAKYLKKGSQIMVEGEVTARAYMGSDGQPKASLDLRVNNFTFLSGGNDSSQQSSDSEYDPVSGQDIENIPF